MRGRTLSVKESDTSTATDRGKVKEEKKRKKKNMWDGRMNPVAAVKHQRRGGSKRASKQTKNDGE